MQEGFDRGFGVGEAALHHGPVAQHDEVFRRQLRPFVGDAAELVSYGLVVPTAVGLDRFADRVFCMRVLGCGVEEGASAEAGGFDLAGDVVRYRTDA